jgi:hypothetical protein
MVVVVPAKVERRGEGVSAGDIILLCADFLVLGEGIQGADFQETRPAKRIMAAAATGVQLWDACNCWSTYFQ